MTKIIATNTTDEIAIEMDELNLDLINDPTPDDMELLLQTDLKKINSPVINYNGLYLSAALAITSIALYFLIYHLTKSALINTPHLEGNFVKGFQEGQNDYLQNPKFFCAQYAKDADVKSLAKFCQQSLQNYADSKIQTDLFADAAASSFAGLGLAIAFALDSTETRLRHTIYSLFNLLISFLVAIAGVALIDGIEDNGKLVGKYISCPDAKSCNLVASINFNNTEGFSSNDAHYFLACLFLSLLITNGLMFIACDWFAKTIKELSFSSQDRGIIDPPISLSKSDFILNNLMHFANAVEDNKDKMAEINVAMKKSHKRSYSF